MSSIKLELIKKMSSQLKLDLFNGLLCILLILTINLAFTDFKRKIYKKRTTIQITTGTNLRRVLIWTKMSIYEIEKHLEDQKSKK